MPYHLGDPYHTQNWRRLEPRQPYYAEPYHGRYRQEELDRYGGGHYGRDRGYLS